MATRFTLPQPIELQQASPLNASTIVENTTDIYSIPMSLRYVGKWVYVRSLNIDYRLVGGIDDTNWVQVQGIPDTSNFYTKTELQTAGQSQVNWNNLTSVPTAFPPETHTHTIPDLADTLVQNPQVNDILTYDGSAWVNIPSTIQKLDKLYKPDGTGYTVYTDNSGALHIDGDIIQNGGVWDTKVEYLNVANALIITRDGATAGLANGEYTGLRAKLYDGANDGMLVFDNRGFAMVGDVGSLQTLLTREDIPIDGGVLQWDAASFMAKSYTTGTAFNKNFGTGHTDVARGDHTHYAPGQDPAWLNDYFVYDDVNKVLKIVQPDGSGQIGFANEGGDITAFADFGSWNPSIWASLPLATATTIGGIYASSIYTNGIRIGAGGFLEIDPTYSVGAVWGQITGNLVDQSDLNTALNGKEPLIGLKGTAFNKNFAGDGVAATVARSDHEHTYKWLADYFSYDSINKVLKLINPDGLGQIGFAVEGGDVTAFADFGNLSPLIWDSMPLATTTTIGGIYADNVYRNGIKIDIDGFLSIDPTFVGGGVTDHGALTGLADNDHPQYLLTTATAANSDKLDGYDSLFFLDKSNYTRKITSKPAINSTGWKRIFQLTSASGHGGYKFTIESTGGTVTPYYKEVLFDLDWADSVQWLYSTGRGYGTQVRITKDVAGNHYVEVNWTAATANTNVNFTITPSMVGNAAAVVLDGAEAAAGGDTVLSIFDTGDYTRFGQDVYANGKGYFADTVRVGSTAAYSGPDTFIVSGKTTPVTVSGTNYHVMSNMYSTYDYNIPAGVTDSGYRMGLSVAVHSASPTLLGTLTNQFGMRIQCGAYTGSGTGTITNSYGLYVQGLETVNTTITNKWGIYQTGANFNNYFNGSVGIGTTNITEKLEVNGTVRVSGDLLFNTVSGRYVTWSKNEPYYRIGTEAYNTSMRYHHYSGHKFYGGIDTINHVAYIDIYGNISAVGEITAYSSSDKYLKCNVKELSYGLNEVRKLNPVSFKWNELAKGKASYKGDEDNIGFIAQEVEEVIPEIVGTVWSEYKGLKYELLTPILTKAIQELDKENKALRSEINEIKKIINDIKEGYNGSTTND